MERSSTRNAGSLTDRWFTILRALRQVKLTHYRKALPVEREPPTVSLLPFVLTMAKEGVKMKCFLSLLIVLCAVPAIAQVPSGHFNYAFTNPALWDLSGIYTNNTVTNDVVIATFEQEASGVLTGARTETYVSGADHAEGTGSLTGRVKTKSGVVGATISSKGEISGVSGGVSYIANFTTKGTATLAPSTLTIFTSGTIRVCVVGGKCESDTQGYSLPLAEGMTGDWTLDLNVVPTGNKLGGTGTLTLSNGRVFSYQIIGSYKTTSQVAKLKLVGEGDATGTSLSLTTQGAAMDLTGLKSKSLGRDAKIPVVDHKRTETL